MSDDQLDQIRKRKMLSMQQRADNEQRQSQQEQVDAQKNALLAKILAPDARQRLNNLKMVKPEFAEQIELQLIEMAQTGKLPIPLSDSQLKGILIQLQSRKREPTIRRI